MRTPLSPSPPNDRPTASRATRRLRRSTGRARTDQIEFGFSEAFRRPRGPRAPRCPREPSARRSRPSVASARRLDPNVEAFASARNPSVRWSALLESAVAIAATMAFGLGWAAYELQFLDAPPLPETGGSYEVSASGYVVSPPLGSAGVEDAEWTTNRFFARTASASKR